MNNKLTRTQAVKESYAMANAVAALLSQHGFNVDASNINAGYTSAGRGSGEVSHYMKYTVKFRGTRVVYAVVYFPSVDGHFYENNAALQDALKAVTL
jgi:hypothetical protein